MGHTNWYPMITHQEQAMDLLALAGPGTPKLGTTKLAECKMEYTFCFKIGGCAPPVGKVTDPTKQPSFAVPANILDTNSLQSPEQPIESFLYQFDWRRDQITERAAQRITKDYSTPQSLFYRCKNNWNISSTAQNTRKRTALVGGGGNPNGDTIRAAPTPAKQTKAAPDSES